MSGSFRHLFHLLINSLKPGHENLFHKDVDLKTQYVAVIKISSVKWALSPPVQLAPPVYISPPPLILHGNIMGSSGKIYRV